MKQIKFRAWHVESKKMFYFSKLNLEKPFYYEYLIRLLSGNCAGKLMQYTGIKDYEGNEIYEGDFLRVPSKTDYENKNYNCFEVFYHSNECIGGQNIGFCINRMHTHGNSAGGTGYRFTPESIRKNNLVRIGNIYENPELLSIPF